MAAHRIGFFSLWILTACASGSTAPPDSPDAEYTLTVTRVDVVEPERIVLEEQTGEQVLDRAEGARDFAASRRVGDYFVYRFAGSSLESPITVAERVVAKKNGLVVVDFSFEESGVEQSLRVRMDGATGEVIKVTTIDQTGEHLAPLTAYSDLLARTVLVPERNERLIEEKDSTCFLGEDAMNCSVVSYAVSVKGRDAILHVSRSAKIPRDVGGEIVTSAGDVLYSAQLIDHGTESQSPESVARNERRAGANTPNAP